MDKPAVNHRAISAASDNATLIRAGKTRLRNLIVTNINAAARYIHFFDKATAPTTGTDTPVLTVLLPAAGQAIVPDIDRFFELGLAYTLTTTIGSGAGNVGANEHTVGIGYNGIA